MDIQGPLAALARSDLKPKLEALPQVEKAVASQQLQPEDYAEVIGTLSGCLKDNNFRVCSSSLGIMGMVIDQMGKGFAPYVGTVLPGVSAKLGDAKEPTRAAANSTLESIMDVVGASEVFETLLPKFADKNWRLKAELAACVTRGVSGPRSSEMPVERLTPKVVSLLGDGKPDVRDEALETLVALYRFQGPGLRKELQKHKLRAAHKSQLDSRFAEVDANGQSPRKPRLGRPSGAGAGTRPPALAQGGSETRPMMPPADSPLPTPDDANVDGRLNQASADFDPLDMANQPKRKPPRGRKSGSAGRGRGGGGMSRDAQREMQRPAQLNIDASAGDPVGGGGGFPGNSGSYGCGGGGSGAARDPDYDPLDMANQKAKFNGRLASGTASRRRETSRSPARGGEHRRTGSGGGGAPSLHSVATAVEVTQRLHHQNNYAPTPIRVYSEKELAKELEKLKLGLTQTDWNTRLDSCTRLQALALGGACEFEGFVPLFKKLINDALLAQVNDLRSAICKAACLAVMEVSKALGDDFEPFSAVFLPHIWTKTIVTIQVIAESAHECVCCVLEYTQAPRLLPKILDTGTNAKDGRLRAACVGYLGLCLQHWSQQALDGSVSAIDAAIRKSMADANGDARTAARRCYWAYKPRWPDRAQRILDTLDPSAQRRLLSEEAGPSTPTHGSYTKRKSGVRSPNSSPKASPSGGGAKWRLHSQLCRRSSASSGRAGRRWCRRWAAG
eukprot:COSAG05_NODE_630_length_8210_cov_5.004563_4_plen_730_part_00